MQRPEVRMVQPQEITTTTDVNITRAEANALLAKYNFNPSDVLINTPVVTDPNQNLSFEEMVALEENKLKRENLKKQEELNRPHAVTFNDRNVNYHNTNFKSLSDTGFGIQVQIVSDMDVNRGYDTRLYR